MVFWQDALSNGLALHDVRWDVAHSGEAAARIQGLFADAQLQVPHLDGLRQWQDALGLSRSMAFIQQEVTDLRLLTAYEPGNSLPPPGTPIGPFREALVPLDQIPDNARGILQYRAIFYDQTTGKYEIGFSFPLSSGFTSEPAFNQRGEAPGNNEVGIFVLLPESPPFPRGQGLNPRLGIRVGYNYRGTGVPYFRVFNSKGQAISPVTGKTVGAGDSHYPLDILRSLRQSY